MTGPRLIDLIYDGEIDQAIERAAPFTPQEIHTQLFLEDDRHLKDEGPCDEFLRTWFASIESPYLRAEAADWFTGTYTTELAPVPNAEYIGAYMRTTSLRELIKKVADVILGPELKDLEETPEHPLDATSAERWRDVGSILADIDLPPAVSPVAPSEMKSE